jgi:hypothetical protein
MLLTALLSQTPPTSTAPPPPSSSVLPIPTVTGTIPATATPDGPKVTDWISSISGSVGTLIAIGALIAAIVAAIATVRTNRTQSAQLQRLEEAQMRERASRFAVWYQVDEVSPRSGRVANRNRDIRYHNASGLPVYELELKVSHSGEWIKYYAQSLSPTMEPQVLSRATNLVKAMQTFLAMRSVEDDFTVQDGALIWFDENLGDEPIRTEYTFSDGESFWLRQENGVLVKLDEAPTVRQSPRLSFQTPFVRTPPKGDDES